MSKVLVIATSRKTRGGITSVVQAHESGEQWRKFHCHWVQTHRDGPNWRKIAYLVSGMFDFLKRLPFYDGVHIHTADYGTEKRKRIFACFSKLFGKKLIVHLHSSGPEYSIGGKHWRLYNYSFTHADKIILLSNTWLEVAKQAFPHLANKMEVLYNPCPQISYHARDFRENYILYAGMLSHRKGFDDLIKAFAKISHKYPNWNLKFAGHGEIEAGMKLALDLGIADKVEFLGWIGGDEKDRVFRHAGIYCLPSYSEGFPMGVLDAWAYHLPVVTTPVGGIPDIAEDGKNILLFNPGDIDTLALKLESLIVDENLYKTLQSASKEFAIKQFSVNAITSKLARIYDSVIGQ